MTGRDVDVAALVSELEVAGFGLDILPTLSGEGWTLGTTDYGVDVESHFDLLRRRNQQADLIAEYLVERHRRAGSFDALDYRRHVFRWRVLTDPAYSGNRVMTAALPA